MYMWNDEEKECAKDTPIFKVDSDTSQPFC